MGLGKKIVKAAVKKAVPKVPPEHPGQNHQWKIHHSSGRGEKTQHVCAIPGCGRIK